MRDLTKIKTTKAIYPQIYAYTLPTIPEKQGWVKIGYTTRENVETRILEQTKTAAISLPFDLLWSEIAKMPKADLWFRDTDFHRYLRQFKHIENEPKTEWFYYNGTPNQSRLDFKDFTQQKWEQIKEEQAYYLRAEQLQAVEQTLAYFKQNPNAEFLWNAKPRFGKTLTTYDVIRQMQAQAVLIVTNRPAIAHSWFDDFEKFIAWQTNYRFISTSDSLKNRPVLTWEEFNQYYSADKKIVFISLQDLKGASCFGGKYDKLAWVKQQYWDLLVIDEAHEGVDTLKTEIAFDFIQRNFTLHLSGTPFKALAKGEFSPQQIFNWTYADEQQAKQNWHNPELNNPYESLPRLNLFSYQMSQMISENIQQGTEIEGEIKEFAFDLNEFFAAKENGQFIYEQEINKWLDTLTKNEKYPFSTPELRAELKHTLWLLNRVDSAKALYKLLKNHPVFDNYEIILAAGDGKLEEEQANSQKSLEKVRTAIKQHPKTITLSVGQLTTGITIPEWTAVMMLSNLQSPSLYMQAAFRAQNPWEYELNGKKYQKENAYVFDFAPERTLMIYDEFANNLSSSRGGTSQGREENIRTLLNFFPVIAEDNAGKMVALDATQVLTIPKMLKAQQVVKRGFMSNWLFQNIAGIFSANEQVSEILSQLEVVDEGKVKSNHAPLEIPDVQVDSEGNIDIPQAIVVAASQAHFGEKIYATMENLQQAVLNDEKNVTTVAQQLQAAVQEHVKNLAKQQGVSTKQAERIVSEKSKTVARELEKVQVQTAILQTQAKQEYEKQLANADSENVVEEARAQYEAKQQQLVEEQQQAVRNSLENAISQFAEQITQAILEKAEQHKKAEVEEDVRARLRGFSRTIPAFLMAYGTTDTTLENFEQFIAPEVFKEVTGISLEQFVLLRDHYHFFDSVVFNQSIQEFLQKRTALANYFDDSQTEDIFDYIPAQQTNQIFTPKAVVKMMVDKLEAEDPKIFKNKDRTFADLYVKSGLYLTEIVKRLYQGLAEHIPDKDERIKHILENQIYGFAPTKIIYHIAHNFIFGFDENAKQIDSRNFRLLDTLPYAKGETEIDLKQKMAEIIKEKEMKFDVIVGNPPYQEQAKGESTKDVPVYHHFIEAAYQLSDQICLITPARFLFNAGSTPKEWNQKMLSDKYLKVLFYEQNSANVFPTTDIKGGVAITYRNNQQECGAIGVFTIFPELNAILGKVEKRKDFSPLSAIIYNRGLYRYADIMYELYPNEMKRVSDRRLASNAFDKLPEFFYDEKPKDGEEYVQIFGRQNNERKYKWFRRNFLARADNLDFFKVILPKANGSGAIGEVLGTPLIGTPLIGYTETFISIGKFDNEFEVSSLFKYIKTKFCRAMLGVLKITQDNTAEKWEKVPLQDFTPNSDIDWSKNIPEIDQQLYQKYGLAENEIAFIESKVKAME